MGKSRKFIQQKNTGSDDIGLSNLGFFSGVGAMVRCDADDDSFFCQLSKFTSMIYQFISLFGVLILIYIIYKYFVVPMFFKKTR